MVKITILDRDLAQFAAFPIIITNIALVCSFLLSLTVPWIRSKVSISGEYFSLNLPVDIGLLKCFSKICDDYADLIYDTKGGSTPHAPAIIISEQLELSTELVHFPSILNHYPSASISANPEALPSTKSMHDVMEAQIRESLGIIKHPYVTASDISLPILSISCFIALISLFITIYCIITRSPLYFKHQLTMLLSTLILNSCAIVAYMFITIPHINGGEYLDGMWISISFTAVGIFLALVSILILDDSCGCTAARPDMRYSPIPDSTLGNDLARRGGHPFIGLSLSDEKNSAGYQDVILSGRSASRGANEMFVAVDSIYQATSLSSSYDPAPSLFTASAPIIGSDRLVPIIVSVEDPILPSPKYDDFGGVREGVDGYDNNNYNNNSNNSCSSDSKPHAVKDQFSWIPRVDSIQYLAKARKAALSTTIQGSRSNSSGNNNGNGNQTPPRDDKSVRFAWERQDSVRKTKARLTPSPPTVDEAAEEDWRDDRYNSKQSSSLQVSHGSSYIVPFPL